MISDSVLDYIQDSVSLVDIVEQAGVKLKPGGKDHFGICPFHDEKTASLSVNDRFYHCLGCGAKGNVFRFLMDHKRLSFHEAVKQAAITGKVALDTIDFNEAQIQYEQRGKKNDILAAAVEYWKRTYKVTKVAKRYIKSRGISAAVAEQYGVGFDDGELMGHLVADKGFDQRDLRAAGLINEKGNSVLYGRVVFPIYKDDRVVNVCGRSLQKNAKIKYLNINKNEGCFNFNLGRKEKELWTVEGVIDALVMISNGIPNVIAHLGTQGFKDSYMASLRRSGVSRLLLLPDHDEPKSGEKYPTSYKTAALTASRALNHGLDVMIGEIPIQGEDPADYFSNSGTVSQVPLFEPLRWIKERTDISHPVLVAKRVSQLGGAPDKQKEFEVRIGGNVWKVSKCLQTASGLRGGLIIQNSKGKEIFKDHIDFWSMSRRRKIAKEIALNESIVDVICSIIEKQFDTICVADREERQKNAQSKNVGALPEYAEELADGLRTSPILLDDIRDDITDMGYVGEDSNKVLLYLIGISAKLKEPLGCFIASDSSAGKSAMLDVVKKLFPSDLVHMVSRMTDNSLYYYKPDDLKNKWLIVTERSNLQDGEVADQNLRKFFSEKQLTLSTPIKDDATGRFETQEKTIFGPIAYAETTTELNIHDENATRLIEINIRETADQTLAVHDYQRRIAMMSPRDARALEKKRQQIAIKHKAFIKSLKPVEVRIPYADIITFPSEQQRARRDFLKFLNLIRTIAFLHQFQRDVVEEDGVLYTDATLEDYEMAYHLSKDAIRKAFSAIPDRSQELLKEIFAILKNTETGLIDIEDDELSSFTIKDLTTAGVKKSPPTIRKHLAPLVDQDIIEPTGIGSRGRGNASKFKVKIASLDDVFDLTAKDIRSPKEMRALLKATKKKVDDNDGFDFDA